MNITKEQTKQFEEAVKPLIKFLSENFNPHVKVIVENNNAEIVEGVYNLRLDKFIND